jgi:predicted Zn-dependent peptidase
MPTTRREARLEPQTFDLQPGLRLHLIRTARFATTWCRVAFPRALDEDAAAVAVLGQVLESATDVHPSRQALAERLDDLYGASLAVGVEKFGERQLLAATLEWPTAYVPGAEQALFGGLGLLREVLTQPARASADPHAPLRADLVTNEVRNLARAHASLRGHRAAWTLRQLLQRVCRGEGFALDARGSLADLADIDGARLEALHAALVSRGPMEVWLVGDVPPKAAKRAVSRQLHWPRSARLASVPRAWSVRAGPARAGHARETKAVQQTRLAFAWRGALRPKTKAAGVAGFLAGILGGGAAGSLFRTLREERGLCYDASASWNRSKGLLIAQLGVDPADEPRARRGVYELYGRLCEGHFAESARTALLEDQRRRIDGMGDNRGALVGWYQATSMLGLDPRPEVHFDRLARVRPGDLRAVGRRLALCGTQALGPDRGAHP